jgi:benzylsuccinate CoA-transferase BbsF subunit
MTGLDTAWLPLQGIRVLDFTWMIAGPLCTRLLANFGADVIKIESFNRVDRVRETGPHPDGPWSFNEDGSFNDVNLGKRSILLNLNKPGAPELAKQLAAVSDVVMANFTGDRLDRWHLGFSDLVSERPDLIFLNMPVFESSGPRRRWGGIGSHINGLTGMNSISGYEQDPPFGLGPLYPDFSGNPFHAGAAILSALVERDRGAGAQLIEVSQYESTISLLGPALLQQSVSAPGAWRNGNHSERSCPHNVYPTTGEEGWIAIDVAIEAQWQALCAVLGREAWCRDPRFAGVAARRAHESLLDELIAAQTAAWPAVELAQQLQAAGVPASPVNHLDDLLADPWYRTEYFTELAGPEGCVFTTHGEPIRPFGRKQPVTRSPSMGEHTDEIFRGLLGLEQPRIDELYAAGVLA